MKTRVEMNDYTLLIEGKEYITSTNKAYIIREAKKFQKEGWNVKVFENYNTIIGICSLVIF